MKQIIHSRGTITGFATTRYIPIFQNSANGEQGLSFTQSVRTPWSAAGTFRNLKVLLTAGPGSGVTRTITLQKNGVDTALTVAVADPATTASDITHSVSISPGDEVNFVNTNSGGTPAAGEIVILMEFDSTNTGESGYVHYNLHGITATAYAVPFVVILPGDYSEIPFTDPKGRVAVDGAVTRYDVISYIGTVGGTFGNETVLAGGETLTMNIVKNGVIQDGTGGTVDTTTVIDSSTSQVSWSGTLPCVIGDSLYLQYVGSGNLAGIQLLGHSACYTATTDGQFMLSVGSAWDPANTNYSTATSPNIDSLTETSVEGIGGPNTFYVTGIVQATNTGEGGSSFTVDMRVNEATPSSTPVCIGIGATGGDGSCITLQCTCVSPGAPSVTITANDRWAIRVRPFVEDPLIYGAAVFGANTTVRAPLAVAFGLDGGTHELVSAGKLKIWGDFEVVGSVTMSSFAGGAGSVTSTELSNVLSAHNALSNVVSALSASHTSLVNRVSVNSATGGSGSVTSNEVSAVSAQAASALSNAVSAINLAHNTLSNVVSNIISAGGGGTSVTSNELSNAVSALSASISNLTSAHDALSNVVSALTPAAAAMIIFKANDETRTGASTGSAAMSIDASLFFSVTSAATYAVEGQLLLSATSAVGDFRFGWSVPTSVVAYWGPAMLSAVSPLWDGQVQTGTPIALLRENQTWGIAARADGAVIGAHFKATFRTGGAAGTVRFTHGVETSTPGVNTVMGGSFLRVQKISP